MTKTLKQKLNQLPQEVVNREWTRFAYSVEARAEYELAKRMQEAPELDRSARRINRSQRDSGNGDLN